MRVAASKFEHPEVICLSFVAQAKIDSMFVIYTAMPAP